MRFYESRELPPPIDEPGEGETDELEAVHEARESAELGMDIDLVQENVDTDLKELMAVLRRDEKLEIEETNREIMIVLRSLGADTAQYRRERKRSIRAVVSEINSLPRVTAAMKFFPELRIIPGFTLDLTTADTDGQLWDFDSKVMRDRALKKIREERPLLLIGSPMCTAFSTWQRINDKIRCPVTVAAEKRRAVKHLDFCTQLYREQLRNGRYFLHEHPTYAHFVARVCDSENDERDRSGDSYMRSMSIRMCRCPRPTSQTAYDFHEQQARVGEEA